MRLCSLCCNNMHSHPSLHCKWIHLANRKLEARQWTKHMTLACKRVGVITVKGSHASRFGMIWTMMSLRWSEPATWQERTRREMVTLPLRQCC